MNEPTMMISEVVDLLLEDDPQLDSDFPGTLPETSALVTVLAIMRSLVQREIATSEGIAASVEKWKEFYGEVTPDSVRNWVGNLGEGLRSIPIPISYLYKVASAD